MSRGVKFAKITAEKGSDDLESHILGQLGQHGHNEQRVQDTISQLGFSMPVNISYVKIRYAGEVEVSNHPVKLIDDLTFCISF